MHTHAECSATVVLLGPYQKGNSDFAADSSAFCRPSIFVQSFAAYLPDVTAVTKNVLTKHQCSDRSFLGHYHKGDNTLTADI